MATGTMSFPFSGDIYYGVETVFGNGIATLDHGEFRISDLIQNVRLGTGATSNAYYSISEPTVAGFSQALWKPELHIEWIWQPWESSLVSYCIDRTSCDLASLAFEIAVNDGCGGVDQFYDCQGCKCKTISLSASAGENYVWSADFSVASVVAAGTAVGTAPAALGASYDFATFNIAGSVAWTGLTESFHITQSINITVDNNLNEYFTVGATGITASFPGMKSVTGSCDLSIDDGGEDIWADVQNVNNFATVVFDAARQGLDQITVTDGVFDSLDIALETGGEGMISSIPWTAKEIAVA